MATWVCGAFLEALSFASFLKGLNEGFGDFGFFTLPIVRVVVRYGGGGIAAKGGVVVRQTHPYISYYGDRLCFHPI